MGPSGNSYSTLQCKKPDRKPLAQTWTPAAQKWHGRLARVPALRRFALGDGIQGLRPRAQWNHDPTPMSLVSLQVATAGFDCVNQAGLDGRRVGKECRSRWSPY